jgi:hypothetical protein
MRPKTLLQMASLSVVTALLVSPAVAQTSGAPTPDTGPGFGLANEALQPTRKALGSAGKAVDEAARQVTGKPDKQAPARTVQSPAAKSEQTPMAKAEPAWDDNSSYNADTSASDAFSQPAAKSDHMAKAEPVPEDADSPSGPGKAPPD